MFSLYKDCLFLKPLDPTTGKVISVPRKDVVTCKKTRPPTDESIFNVSCGAKIHGTITIVWNA